MSHFFSWDKQYLLEHKNFDEIGDRGEVWFGEAAMNRMIRWLEKNVPQSSKIIDLGCGNGVMCIELYEVGFKNVLGVDYSSHAIELAQKIAIENDILDLQFEVSCVETDTKKVNWPKIRLIIKINNFFQSSRYSGNFTNS